MSHPLQSYYSRIYKTYDLVNRIFTLGLDRKWRNQTAKACLAAGPENILDLCCGTGDLAITLSKKAGSKVTIIGYDLNPDMLEVARKKSLQYQVKVEFQLGDAGNMPFSADQFDAVTIGFGFRNLTWDNPNRDNHIREIFRVMKPGATLLILESALPEIKVIAGLYKLYLKMVLVPLGGLLSGNWQAYRYLAGSSAGFYSYSSLRMLLAQHGLTLKTRRNFLFGSVNLLTAVKKAS